MAPGKAITMGSTEPKAGPGALPGICQYRAPASNAFRNARSPRRAGSAPGPHARRVCGGRGGARRRCLDMNY
jgi:hypothetical protein